MRGGWDDEGWTAGELLLGVALGVGPLDDLLQGVLDRHPWVAGATVAAVALCVAWIEGSWS